MNYDKEGCFNKETELKMKFSVGYQMTEPEGEPFSSIVEDHIGHIGEVYFPWVDIPTCRASLSDQRGYVDWSVQKRLEEDLEEIKKMGVKLDILFNANCYGGEAVSMRLANRVVSVIDYLGDHLGGIEIVTTTSPAIAHIVKENFKEMEVRASVNMRIGTIKGMEYVAHLFDSFHVQRDYNRDLKTIANLKKWADKNNKKLIMLANSGCMRFCSGQVFHDNMVAHEAEIDEMANIPKWTPHVCWNFLKDKSNWVSILQNTWIRPEDIHNYEKYFDVIKLATRMHSMPRMVIKAYADRKYYGNLADLCEPGYGPALVPYAIDNALFPDDWFKRTSECAKNCESCSYCASVLEKVLKKMP